MVALAGTEQEPAETFPLLAPLDEWPGEKRGDRPMYELHENEQYFFDEPTLEHLSGFLSQEALEVLNSNRTTGAT